MASISLPKEIAAMPGLSHGAKLAFAWLFSQADRRGSVVCDQQALADAIGGKSVRSVERYLDELKAAQLLYVESPGIAKPNTYRLRRSEDGYEQRAFGAPMDAGPSGL